MKKCVFCSVLQILPERFKKIFIKFSPFCEPLQDIEATSADSGINFVLLLCYKAHCLLFDLDAIWISELNWQYRGLQFENSKQRNFVIINKHKRSTK